MKLLHDLTGAERDVLRCLFFHGPTWDGDVPSKTGRDGLEAAGYAEHRSGWAWLTAAGIQLALDVGLDREKEKWQRERAEKSAELATSNAGQALLLKHCRGIVEQMRLAEIADERMRFRALFVELKEALR